MQDAFLTFAALAVAALLVVAGAYNGLAALRQEVRDAWADMDAELRHRYDLLPSLVAASRAAGEAPPALAAVLAAKNQAAVAFSPQQLATAEAALSAHLRELFATRVAGLDQPRADLTAAEGRIVRAARRYNAAVAEYSAVRGSFPHGVVAATCGFQAQPAFEPPTV